MPWCHHPRCNRYIGSNGVANHRMAHRRREERVTMTLASGTWVWDFRSEEEKAAEPTLPESR